MRLLWRDLFLHIYLNKYMYLVLFLISGFYALIIGQQEEQVDLATLFIQMFRDTGFLSRLSDYYPPIFWLLFHFIIVVCASRYVSHDWEQNSVYLFIRIKKKSAYWHAKMSSTLLIIWMICTVFFIWVMLIGLVTEGPDQLFSQDAINKLSIQQGVTLLQVVVRLYVSTTLTVMTLCLLTIAAALIAPLHFVLLFVFLLIGIDTFANVTWLPGVHSLVMKQDLFVEGGTSFLGTVLSNISYSLIAVIISYLAFWQKEIY